jgi:hypothetical protein
MTEQLILEWIKETCDAYCIPKPLAIIETLEAARATAEHIGEATEKVDAGSVPVAKRVPATDAQIDAYAKWSFEFLEAYGRIPERIEIWNATRDVPPSPQVSDNVRDAKPVAWMLETPGQSSRWYTSGRQAMEHWVKSGAVSTPLYGTPQAVAQNAVRLPEGYIELNMSNYDADDVSRLNEWAIAAYGVLESAQQDAAIESQPAEQSTDARDAARYRWATEVSGNADMLHSIVLCHEGDDDKIRARIDSYRAVSDPSEKT